MVTHLVTQAQVRRLDRRTSDPEAHMEARKLGPDRLCADAASPSGLIRMRQ